MTLDEDGFLRAVLAIACACGLSSALAAAPGDSKTPLVRLAQPRVEIRCIGVKRGLPGGRR